MEVVGYLTGGILITALFATIFCVTGKMLLDRIGFHADNRYHSAASSFFIGMGIYLAVVRTLALIIPSYKITFWLVLAVFLVLTGMEIYRHYRSWFLQRKYLAAGGGVVVLWFLHIVHALLFRIQEMDKNDLAPFSSIGTICSIRYANIADYFVKQDDIPVLNQSYGQSLLSSFSNLFGMENTCFTLVLWLALSAAFLCFFLYGIFIEHFGKGFSIILTCVVHMGSVALTLAPIRVVDSDYPFLSNGYTDSIAGTVTFIIYLEILVHVLLDSGKMTCYHYFVTVCTVIYWEMSAPQNICVLLGTGFFLICYLLYQKDYANTIKGVKLAGVVLIGCLVGILEGGMLTPSFLLDSADIDGIMLLSEEIGESTGIALVPVMTYQVSRSPGELWNIAQEVSFMKETLNCAVEALHSGEIYVLAHCLSSLWWDSVRVIFWPLLGVLGVGAAAYHKKDKKINYWAVIGFSTLLLGYIPCFFISYNGYKWALARFMMPFYLLGMIFTAFFLGKAWKKRGLYRCIGALSIFLILVSQTVDKVIILYNNCRYYDVPRLMKDMIIYTK